MKYIYHILLLIVCNTVSVYCLYIADKMITTGHPNWGWLIFAALVVVVVVPTKTIDSKEDK